MKIERLGAVVLSWVGMWECLTCNCVWIMESGDTCPSIAETSGGKVYHRMKCPTCSVAVRRVAGPWWQEEARK